ncbi:biotin--[acetyl-CoA-carboxylase] ligase [Pseudothioglobus sp. nBUS_23]|uniref:biotin--[acetyl-CoA-carboxylase] ligase n=1 Tax=Pseudothioglobus sp. nBUS_23 TaxID=3395318 RepID=UPI003EBB41F9
MDHYSSLKKRLDYDLDCHFFDSIDSTNAFLANSPYETKTQLCVTREQTKGYGQHGRKWASQKDGSIIFSIRKSFHEHTNINGLSLVVGLAIIKSIEYQCQSFGLKIKWPNDIYYEDKKLAGILMENNIHNGKQYVLIGVGVNFKLSNKIVIDAPWVDLSRIANRLPNFQHLTASIINNIIDFSDDFQANGLSSLLSHWEDYDMLKGVLIKSKESGQEFQGKIDGITNQGALKVLTEDGVKELYSSMHIEYI